MVLCLLIYCHILVTFPYISTVFSSSACGSKHVYYILVFTASCKMTKILSAKTYLVSVTYCNILLLLVMHVMTVIWSVQICLLIASCHSQKSVELQFLIPDINKIEFFF